MTHTDKAMQRGYMGRSPEGKLQQSAARCGAGGRGAG